MFVNKNGIFRSAGGENAFCVSTRVTPVIHQLRDPESRIAQLAHRPKVPTFLRRLPGMLAVTSIRRSWTNYEIFIR